jgi:hypothetical protein
LAGFAAARCGVVDTAPESWLELPIQRIFVSGFRVVEAPAAPENTSPPDRI